MIKKITNNKLLLRGGLFSIFSFFNQGISFFLLIILANYISPDEYGNLSLFNTLVMFIGYFIAFSTQGYISVSYYKHKINEFKQNFSSIIYIGVMMLALFIFIIYLWGSNISSSTLISKDLLYAAIIICFFQLLTNINLDYFRIKEKIKLYGLFSCGFALMNFLITLLLIVGYSYGWEGRIYAQLYITILFGIIALYYFQKNQLFTFNVKASNIKQILFWGIPLIPHLATIWLKQGCDRYIINYYYSLEEVGIFSFALNLSSIITMIGFAFNQINSVEIYKILGDTAKTNMQKMSQLNSIKSKTQILYIISSIAVIIICCGLVPLLLPQYTASIKYFIPLGIYSLFVCIYLLYCNYLFYYEKNKTIMYITFGSSVFHLLLSLILTKYSLLATAGIYIISQSIIVIYISKLSNKILKNKLCIS